MSTIDGVSVIVPAHNEAGHLPKTLEAITVASRVVAVPVEVIVVANRCTDTTVAVATSLGATVVINEDRNIAAVRNAGVAAANHNVIVTVDADCLMHPSTLTEVTSTLDSNRYVGGGTRVVPERRSLGIAATYAVMELTVALTRLGGGLFWCRRDDFDAVGGFNEGLELGEDVDFARRLRRWGRHSGRRFTNFRSVPLVASCRKFDRFGDWHMFAMVLQLRQIRAAVNGSDSTWVDRYFYDFND